MWTWPWTVEGSRGNMLSGQGVGGGGGGWKEWHVWGWGVGKEVEKVAVRGHIDTLLTPTPPTLLPGQHSMPAARARGGRRDTHNRRRGLTSASNRIGWEASDQIGSRGIQWQSSDLHLDGSQWSICFQGWQSKFMSWWAATFIFPSFLLLI